MALCTGRSRRVITLRFCRERYRVFLKGVAELEEG